MAQKVPLNPTLGSLIVLLWLIACIPTSLRAAEVGSSADPRGPVTEDPNATPARGRVLVARPGLPDPRFARSVVLLIEYGADGAMGLIVNRATRLELTALWPPATQAGVAWYGGPVRSNVASVLVDSADAPESSTGVIDRLYFSAERALMETLMQADRARFRIYLGYAGWAPQQLDAELARGDWHVSPATMDQVFSDEGEGLWQKLLPERGRWVTLTPSLARASLLTQ